MIGKFKPARGFTLFEVLIAVSIFALIAAMTMTNLIQVGKAGEQVSKTQRQLADIQFALSYLGKDLAQRIDRKVRDQYGDVQPGLLVDVNRLVFTRAGWNNLLQQPRSNLQRVEYRLVDTNLQRRYWPQLDQGFEEQVLEQALLTEVEDFSVKLLTRGEETLENWPPLTESAAQQQPVALELILELKDFGVIRRVFEMSNVQA